MSEPPRVWWRGSVSSRPAKRTTEPRSPPKQPLGVSSALTWETRHVSVSRDSRRVDALQRHIETSTDASLRIAERTSAVAQATLQELSQQSLGLERASKSLETAEKGVEESEDTLAALNRKCGCFAFPGVTACFPARRASRFRVSETQTNVEALETYRSSTSQPKLRKTKGGFSLKKAPGGTKGTALVVEKNPIKAQTDLKSNAIDSALEYLHQASTQMGEHLDAQHKTIDDVATRSENLNDRLARAERRGR